SPPGFVVKEIVLGEAAHINDAKLRVDRRPSIGSRLPAIVKTGPGKSPGQPFPSCIEFPPLFGKLRPRGVIQVVGAHPVSQLVGGVNSARGNRARSLRAYRRFLGMGLVP